MSLNKLLISEKQIDTTVDISLTLTYAINSDFAKNEET